MADVISLLYNGEINPAEQMAVHDKKYHTYLLRTAEWSERLNSTFSSAQHELFQHYESSSQEASAYLNEKAFRVGFQMGLQIAFTTKGR